PRWPRTRALALAVAPLVMLAACGGDDGTGGITPPQADATSEETTSVDGHAAAPTSGGTIQAGFNSAPGGGTGGETTTEPDGPKEVTIGAAGDILLHAPVIRNAQANSGGEGYDFFPMFGDVTDLLSDHDLTICHMETPISADNTNLTVPRVLVFNSPHQIADALVSAGYDGCDFASNHTWDQGLGGLADTQQVIEEAGLEYAGPVADEDEAGHYATYEVDDVTVAQLGYTYTIYNSG